MGPKSRVNLRWFGSSELFYEGLFCDLQALICVVVDYLDLLFYRSLKKTEFCFIGKRLTL